MTAYYRETRHKAKILDFGIESFVNRRNEERFILSFSLKILGEVDPANPGGIITTEKQNVVDAVMFITDNTMVEGGVFHSLLGSVCEQAGVDYKLDNQGSFHELNNPKSPGAPKLVGAIVEVDNEHNDAGYDSFKFPLPGKGQGSSSIDRLEDADISTLDSMFGLGGKSDYYSEPVKDEAPSRNPEPAKVVEGDVPF